MKAKRFILRFGIKQGSACEKNAKGDLQEFLQKRGEEMPIYQTKKTGKDNEPFFYATVTAMGESAQGQGKSKRLAEQEAADKLLEKLQKSERSNAKNSEQKGGKATKTKKKN